jgi:hypothetical protein
MTGGGADRTEAPPRSAGAVPTTAPPRSAGAVPTTVPPRSAGAVPTTEALYRLAFVALSIACVWPLFYVRYAPIEDLPQHLAAIRVLHDLHDPAFGLAQYFEVHLLRTQYLAYYLAADALAYVAPLELANKLLVAASLIATPWAARSVRRELGKDDGLALLLFPLAYNAHLILGFFNFIAAIGLSLYGVALALQQRRRFSRARAIGSAALCVVCFYTHVVPFALMAVAIVLVGSYATWRAAARSLAPLLPAALATLLWLFASPAGHATLVAAGSAQSGPQPTFTPAAYALTELPSWLTDVLSGDQDRRLLEAWVLLVGLALAIALCELMARRWFGKQSAAPADELEPRLGWRLLPLPIACAVLYFVAPTSYDWIWPIAQRFPLLCATWLVVVLPRARFGRHALCAIAVVLSCASFHYVGKAFAAFDREEVGDFDRALATIPRAQRVVGLIFDRSSRHVAFSPFIHYVAYYQARKGGAVMFSFADFPQSPFAFRQDNRPPRVPPRWEWLPEHVRPGPALEFYDYALVRGGPGAIARRNSGFTAVFRGERWSVWKHVR